MEQGQLMEEHLNFREGIASGGKAIKFRCFITKDNVKKISRIT